MRGRNGAVVFVVVILVSSLSFALPGAGSLSDDALENLDRGPPWEPRERGGWDTADGGSTDREPDRSSPPLRGLESLHRAGIDGDGASVGVIGSQFDAAQPSLGSSVAAHRTFARTGPIQESTGTLLSRDAHDTAVAEIVARTAPASTLYLADVGQDATPERYAEAVEWLLEKDVDVIVDAASYFPADADGMRRLNAVASDAADQGVVFVTSAGNYANRHWAGTVSGEGWVEFAPGTPYNELGEGKLSGHTSLRLYWEGDADFDLYLYRNTPGEDTLVAKSERKQTETGHHSEAIDASLPKGSYYVAVRGDAGANGTTVELFAAEHAFAETSDEGGMVAPATAENVIAVGAVDSVSGEPQPYSSTGEQLDISAPDGARTAAAGELRGSSAAAPLVAGTVALMVSQNESLTPTDAQQVLTRTAIHTNGRLYLDTAAAVDAVSGREIRHPTSPISGSSNETYLAGDGAQASPSYAATAEGGATNQSAADGVEPAGAGDETASEPTGGWVGD